MSPQFQNFTVEELCSAAGGDPWKFNDGLQAGNAGAINDLADAFYGAGKHTQEADQEFGFAKRDFTAYRRNDTQNPINDAEEVKRVSYALSQHPEQLAGIAVDLEQVAAALARAQHDSAAKIAALESELHGYDDQMSAVLRDTQKMNHKVEANGTTEGEKELTDLKKHAEQATKSALEDVEGIQGAYIEQLHGAETAMVSSGYAPDALDGVDGEPDESPDAAARRYDQSGQRARDQALVDANKNGIPDDEVRGAQQRLWDYQAITAARPEPPARVTPTDANELEQSNVHRRLAGQRLDDFNVANSTGPVPKDTLLGGDARTRAQARLQLQQRLENPGGSQRARSPDEATQAVNSMELTDRAAVLGRTQQLLEQQGVPKALANAIVDDAAHGVSPKVWIDAASHTSKALVGLGTGTTKFSDAVTDHGGHWTPEAREINAADVEALAKIGKRLSRAGTLIDVGAAIADWANGAPADQVIVKEAGSLAGSWAMAEALAPLGAPFGPVGVFVAATGGAILGSYGGEAAALNIYKFLNAPPPPAPPPDIPRSSVGGGIPGTAHASP